MARPGMDYAWAKEARMAEGYYQKRRTLHRGRGSARQWDEGCNLKGRFCCRVAAEAVIVDQQYNFLL
jgi:hypothetical protein